ncbi:MAG: hypothetical protein ACLSH8_17540 [Zhenhengia sp.]|uniref:hypothetical protein n=1 Tax=Zhenhengia sp. TaxID=2944208 RepID=UPI003996A6A7
MRRYGYPYNGKRYLLNTNTKEVHDLDNESHYCYINDIKLEHVKMFDNLNDALCFPYSTIRENDGCYWCLPNHHTK